jgi:hypothetical protein
VLFPSSTDAFFYAHHPDPVIDDIARFLTGQGPPVRVDRILTTVLFTDIVASTERAVVLGDRRWRSLLDSHDAVARTIIDQHRGRLIKLTGDGVLATFDGPGRAIRCALAFRDAVNSLGLKIRAALHTGEVELRGEDIGSRPVWGPSRLGRRPPPRGGIGHRVRRPRRARAQGPRQLAALRRRGLNEPGRGGRCQGPRRPPPWRRRRGQRIPPEVQWHAGG